MEIRLVARPSQPLRDGQVEWIAQAFDTDEGVADYESPDTFYNSFEAVMALALELYHDVKDLEQKLIDIKI